MTEPSPAIVVEHLQKNYGKIQALQGIDLTVQPEDFAGLLGSNGAANRPRSGY